MIFTGSYKLIPELMELGWRRSDIIGISCGEHEDCINYYRTLAPNWNWVKQLHQYRHSNLIDDMRKDFERKFKRYLMSLPVAAIAAEAQGCILLCFEDSDQFCHRHIVRAWFNNFGYPCIEFHNRIDYEARAAAEKRYKEQQRQKLIVQPSFDFD